jgi:D-3-phosphoglycerate dehydrogenase
MKIIGLLELPIDNDLSRYVQKDIQIIPLKDISEKQFVNVYALFTKVSCKIDSDLIRKYPNLAFIGVPATGIDVVDYKICKEKGIKILSLKDEKFTKRLNEFTSTSEIFFWHLLSLVRNCQVASQSIRDGFWNRNNFIGANLRGLTLGIIGFGRIGKQIADIGKLLGLNVIFFDKNVESLGNSMYLRVSSLEDLISKSNIVSVNVDYSDENLNLVNYSVIQNISKKPFYVINTSRGAIVDELAILDGLGSGKIDGYGADVLTNEVSGETNWLIENHVWQAFKSNKFKISLTPHIGGATYQNMNISEEYILSELVNELRG